MHTVTRPADETPQPHLPQYPPPADLAAIDAAIAAWHLRRGLPCPLP